mmetsp:Transcript_36584/g.66332  ORF Transcript_36584/g.66332 Transcript_36584/m.66332 type:complete len:482 (+) Transcript_36584:36-1481(+)
MGDAFDPWASAVEAGGGSAPTKKAAGQKKDTWGSFKAGEAAALPEELATKPGKQGPGKKKKGAGREDTKKPFTGPTGPNLARRRLQESTFWGHVESWQNSYGWIRPTTQVHHPKAMKHGGKIYVHNKDVVGGMGFLAEGAPVEFYVFEDDAGLGAEEVRVTGEPKGGKGGKGKDGWKGGWQDGWGSGKGGPAGWGGPGKGNFGGWPGADGFGEWGKGYGKDFKGFGKGKGWDDGKGWNDGNGKGWFDGKGWSDGKGWGKEGKGWSEGKGDSSGSKGSRGKGEKGDKGSSSKQGSDFSRGKGGSEKPASEDWSSYSGGKSSSKGGDRPPAAKGTSLRQESNSYGNGRPTPPAGNIGAPLRQIGINQGTSAIGPSVASSPGQATSSSCGGMATGPCAPYMPMGNMASSPMPVSASIGSMGMPAPMQFGGIMPGMPIMMGGQMNSPGIGMGIFSGQNQAGMGMSQNAGGGYNSNDGSWNQWNSL